PIKRFLLRLSESFEVEAGIYNYKFESKLDIPEDLKVNMDSALVTRSLENLMFNAYRYSFPESLISFSVFVKQETIDISIINRGEGIGDNELLHIFEPFYRGSKGRNEEGFGLGLANVAAVIKSHGWEITAKSELKKETVFTIKIPIGITENGGRRREDGR
ncbi:MAG: sensor histidine kinase, partial [Spirochaetota bacterium]|nr:sensor histidine kinase [Spirochaetota bacterium]